MIDRHSASNCLWAVPTLFLDAPLWLEASDRPWACLRVSPARTLEFTDECAACPHWQSAVAVNENENWADNEPYPLLPDVIAGRF